jgi:malonyl-CoA/methylmalonyl-CoA synthetase
VTLTALFHPSLVARRQEIGLEFEDAGGRVTAFTFGAIDDRANRMARALEARGLTAGDRLVVQLPNSVEFLDLLLASLRLGLIFVPVNVLYRDREVAHIVNDAAPALSVASGDVADLSAAAASMESTAVHRTFDGPGGEGDAPAALVYTSGTTGRSKGAVLSHNNFAANTANLLSAWAITSADRYFAALPLFHVHGLGNGVMTWLASGCRMRLVERFDAAHIGAQLESFQPTLFFGVPTMYVRMLEMDAAVAARIGASARLFVSGSAPLPAAVLEAFHLRFGHTILERYGMSETLMNISNPYAGERRAGSVGVPLPGVSVRIVDGDGHLVLDGTVGEIELRGANVFAGYWNNPGATAAAFHDGWFRTGDLATRSPDGYYTLCGRRSDLIISGGFNIYPREIEEVLLEQAGVREVAVVGVPDERRGEVPVAYVVADDTVDDATLRDVCSRQLASFKVPRAFIRVNALPRTALGKVQKHLL